MAQITQIQIFGSAAFGEIKYHSLRATPQKKKYCFGIFRGTSKCVLVYGSNNSDSFVSGNVAFGEIKDHSLRMTSFQKKILLWKF